MTPMQVTRAEAVRLVINRLHSPADRVYARKLAEALECQSRQQDAHGLDPFDPRKVERKLAAVFGLSGGFRPKRQRPMKEQP